MSRERANGFRGKKRKILAGLAGLVVGGVCWWCFASPYSLRDLWDAYFEVGIHLSDQELAVTRVQLPPPKNGKWKALMFHSGNALEPEHRELATELLPLWIRKSLAAGNKQRAGRYLTSLIQLVRSEDERTSAEAALALYRLGDSGDVAFGKMVELLRSKSKLNVIDRVSDDGSNPRNVRHIILCHADFYGDVRFVDLAYDLWLQDQSGSADEAGDFDLAYYLEAKGKLLPRDYWLRRLGNYKGIKATVEVLTAKPDDEVVARMKEVFTATKDREFRNATQQKAPVIAAALFQLTGEQIYRDYVLDCAKVMLNGRARDFDRSDVMQGLTTIGDAAARELLQQALVHQNSIFREAAIEALGEAKWQDAVVILQREAERTFAGKRFPSAELHALLAQRSVTGDVAYANLRTAITMPATGWHAGDFERLEFFRKFVRDKRLH